MTQRTGDKLTDSPEGFVYESFVLSARRERQRATLVAPCPIR